MTPSPWRPALCFALFSSIGCTPDGSDSNRCRCSMPFGAGCARSGGKEKLISVDSRVVRLSVEAPTRLGTMLRG
jgi:hypothetical protein